MKLHFRTKFVNHGNYSPLLMLTIIGLFLNGCATVTHFPSDMAKDIQLTPAQAVEIIQKEARASSSDADYRSFVVDKKGFSFAKTEKVEKEQIINGIKTVVEHEKTDIHHLTWQDITQIDPYLKETFIGDLYGVRLSFLTSRVVFSQRMNFNTELNLYCDNHEELSYLVTAIKTLITK